MIFQLMSCRSVLGCRELLDLQLDDLDVVWFHHAETLTDALCSCLKPFVSSRSAFANLKLRWQMRHLKGAKSAMMISQDVLESGGSATEKKNQWKLWQPLFGAKKSACIPRLVYIGGCLFSLRRALCAAMRLRQRFWLRRASRKKRYSERGNSRASGNLTAHTLENPAAAHLVISNCLLHPGAQADVFEACFSRTADSFISGIRTFCPKPLTAKWLPSAFFRLVLDPLCFASVLTRFLFSSTGADCEVLARCVAQPAAKPAAAVSSLIREEPDGEESFWRLKCSREGVFFWRCFHHDFSADVLLTLRFGMSGVAPSAGSGCSLVSSCGNFDCAVLLPKAFRLKLQKRFCKSLKTEVADASPEGSEIRDDDKSRCPERGERNREEESVETVVAASFWCKKECLVIGRNAFPDSDKHKMVNTAGSLSAFFTVNLRVVGINGTIGGSSATFGAIVIPPSSSSSSLRARHTERSLRNLTTSAAGAPTRISAISGGAALRDKVVAPCMWLAHTKNVAHTCRRRRHRVATDASRLLSWQSRLLGISSLLHGQIRDLSHPAFANDLGLGTYLGQTRCQTDLLVNRMRVRQENEKDVHAQKAPEDARTILMMCTVQTLHCCWLPVHFRFPPPDTWHILKSKQHNNRMVRYFVSLLIRLFRAENDTEIQCRVCTHVCRSTLSRDVLSLALTSSEELGIAARRLPMQTLTFLILHLRQGHLFLVYHLYCCRLNDDAHFRRAPNKNLRRNIWAPGQDTICTLRQTEKPTLRWRMPGSTWYTPWQIPVGRLPRGCIEKETSYIGDECLTSIRGLSESNKGKKSSPYCATEASATAAQTKAKSGCTFCNLMLKIKVEEVFLQHGSLFDGVPNDNDVRLFPRLWWQQCRISLPGTKWTKDYSNSKQRE
eukprot:284817067_4